MKKFFEELSRRLREGGVESSNVEDRRLEIFLHGQPVLFVSPGNDVFLFPAGSNNPEASELYHRVAQTADEVYTYVEAVQTAPTLHISGLSEKFHLLADFGGAVLAGRELENGRGYQFVTWIWDYNRTGVSYGHYYDEDFCGAKQDFAVRSGLISKTQLFSPEELTELYRATDYLLDEGPELEDGHLKAMQTARTKIEYTLTADAQLGDTDNPNEVVLTWKRTNTTYFDTLKDCCHVYVYAIDLLKQFSDNNGTFGKVKFIAYNDTDGYYIKANMEGEVYNVTGFTSNKSEATMLIPNLKGHIVLRGIEDDTYTLTEVATDKGYVLPRDPVKVVVTTKEDGICERCGAALLTASATVNGEPVSMTDANAVVPLRIINNPGFDLPKTGGYGTWMFTIGGVALLGAAGFIVIRSRKQHRNEQ